MRTRHIIILIASVLLLSGCAIYRHVDYRSTSAFATPTTEITVLGAQDQRPYVVNKTKPVDYAGVIFTTAGKPYDMHTSSGDPLANELGSVIIKAFRTNGTNIAQVDIPAGASTNARSILFKSTYYLLEIREWQTDMPVNTSFLTYDLSLSIIDVDGSVLSTKSVSGKDELGHDPYDKNLSAAVSRIFSNLVNDSSIENVAPLPIESTSLLPSTETKTVLAPTTTLSAPPTSIATEAPAPVQPTTNRIQAIKTKGENTNRNDWKLKSSGKKAI